MDNDRSLELSYEDAAIKLEEIIKKLEGQAVSLDESLKLYEEAISLYRYCNEVLDMAELKITKFNDDGSEEEVEI